MSSIPKLDGLLLVDKEPGVTSHDLVAKLRKILGISSVGHCGTLDPLASGLMVMLIGEGTKLSQYILEGDKAYEMGFKLGVSSDTFDSTGQCTSSDLPMVARELVLQQAEKLQGEFEFPVPIFSAVKVQGKKLYEYARQDEEVKVPVKKMKFWDLNLIQQQHPDWTMAVSCSKGSYIRTWINELGLALGTGAVMTSLRRTYSSPYQLNQAETIESIRASIAQGLVPKSYVPLIQALPHVGKVRVSGLDYRLLMNGQIGHELRVQLIQKFDPEKAEVIQAVSEDSQNLLALITFDSNKGFVIRRVINQAVG